MPRKKCLVLIAAIQKWDYKILWYRLLIDPTISELQAEYYAVMSHYGGDDRVAIVKHVDNEGGVW